MKNKNEFYGPTPEQMGYKKDEGPDEFGPPLKEDASGRPIKEETKPLESKSREWGTPLTEAELKEIGLNPGDRVGAFGGGTGVIIDIKKYDIDGGTIMALVEGPDGKRGYTNVRILNKAENQE